MKHSALLSFIVLFLLSACCTATNTPVENIIEIDKKGRPGIPDSDAIFTRKDYEEHLEKNLLNFGNKKKVIIFIHGGLNTTECSEVRAEELKTKFGDEYHPVFIHWRSDLTTTYIEHLWNHRQGEHWDFWGPVTSPIVFGIDIGKGIVRTPMIWWYQLVSFLKACGYDAAHYENAKKIGTLLENDPRVNYTPGEDYRGNSLEIFQGVIGFFEFAGSLITAPLFDAVGTGSWDVMKRRTDTMFATMFTADDLDEYKSLDEYERMKQGSLAIFFEKLKTKNLSGVEVILVGHSMGTIVASEILSKWPEIQYDRIIFMAAACTIKDFERSVAPYLKKHPDTEFYNYTLHPKAENYEAHFGGFGGTGSLLVQIDNFYANPVSEKERTLGKWENIMNGFNYFDDEILGRLHFCTMDYDPTVKNIFGKENPNPPIKHGDFGASNNFWKEDYCKTSRIKKSTAID
ncbi:MAG: hypothetical protein KKE17_12450 [Proteobacteria bacterium]|nr:hypothetical protein [Pseudomonadota bacterium]MBU1710809.1 hypothetical protein [Pseudomonadota bacterium]